MLTINDVSSLSEGITVNGLTAKEWSAKVNSLLLKIYEHYGELDPINPDDLEKMGRRETEIEIFLNRPVSYLG